MDIINFYCIDDNCDNNYNDMLDYFKYYPEIQYQLEAIPYYRYRDLSYHRKKTDLSSNFDLYLCLDKKILLGALLIVKYSYCKSINYIFVYPENRNQGVASNLIKKALTNHNDLITSSYSEDGYNYLRPLLIKNNIPESELRFNNPVKIEKFYEKNNNFFLQYIEDDEEYTVDVTFKLNSLYKEGYYLSLLLIEGKYYFELESSDNLTMYIPAISFFYTHRKLFF